MQMNTEIKGSHVEITDKIRDYIGKKMPRLDFAKDYLIDLLFHFSQEKSQYRLEANINFRWGSAIHVGEDSYDIFEGIDRLFDKMELKVSKEKKRVQDHKGHETMRTTEGE
jgi:putative sigma-54 modulation protein